MPVMPVRETQRHARRKVMRQGNSLAIALPAVFRQALGILPGDFVWLTFDAEWGGVFLRPENERELRPVTPERYRAIAEAAKP